MADRDVLPQTSMGICAYAPSAPPCVRPVHMCRDVRLGLRYRGNARMARIGDGA